MQTNVIVLIVMYSVIAVWALVSGCIIREIIKKPTEPNLTLMIALAGLALLGLLGMWAYMHFYFTSI